MLASITPLGERSRHQRWPVTVAAHALGGLAGGAAAGALLGGLGALVHSASAAALTALGALLLAGVLLDLRVGPLRLPSHRRQVDERWLRRYRGWVYGAGFGAQLGTGAATVVTSSAVYATLAACLLAPSPAWGCAIGAAFGLSRGGTPLAAARVADPERLLRLHRLLARHEPTAAATTVALQALLGIAALAAGATWHA
jgi:hypothetical protein